MVAPSFSKSKASSPASTSNPLLAHSLSLISLHLLTRLITFSLNQLLLRTTTPRAFGLATVQFEVVLGGVVFLAREGVREVCLRGGGNVGAVGQGEKKEAHPQSLTNLTYLPFVLGIPLTLLSYLIYAFRLASPETVAQPHFMEAVVLYAIAGMLELASEPMLCLALTTLRTSSRVRAEGLGVTLKSIITFVVLYLSSNYPQYLRAALAFFPFGKFTGAADSGEEEFALLAFAFGQLAYGATLLMVYIWAFRDQREKLRFRALSGAGRASCVHPFTLTQPQSSCPTLSPPLRCRVKSNYFNTATLTLALTINAQSLLKHVLTEGDKLVLSYFSPLDGQGGYAIAANYGSLVARLLFQPIEETLRLFFSRTLALSATPESGLLSLRRAHSSLLLLLNTQLSFSLLLITFAPLYLPYVLPILLPPAFLHSTNAGELLGVWIWYLPFLSVNGALEAFVAVTSGKWDLARQSFFMFIFSVLYLSSAYTLYKYYNAGDASFIYANMVSLTARIAYALFFIRHFFRSRYEALAPQSSQSSERPQHYPFSYTSTKWLPHPRLVAACGFSWVILTSSPLQPPSPPRVYTTRLGPIKQLFEPRVLVYVGVGLVLASTSVYLWWVTSGRDVKAAFGGSQGSGVEKTIHGREDDDRHPDTKKE